MQVIRSLQDVRCLVTGAGGFIGRATVATLKRSGAIVTGFGRQHSADPDIQWVNGNFDDPLALAQACERQDVVIHLLNSSTPATATQQPAGDVTSNVVPTIHLLEACVAAGVKRFLFASSGGTVYGPVTHIPVSENEMTAPISGYGISKLAIEKYSAMFENIHGLEYRILRIANPYGPGQSPFRGQGVVAAMLYAALYGQPIQIWGDGSVVRDYVYIDDVANAIQVLILHQGIDRIFNIGSGVGRSINQVFKDLHQVIEGYPIIADRKPGRSVDVPANVLDITRIQGATGWSPAVEWIEGLRLTADWLRSPDCNIRASTQPTG